MGYRCYLCHGSGYSDCKYCGGSGTLGADLSDGSSGGSSGSSSGTQNTKITLSAKKLTLVAGRSKKLKVSGTKKKVQWSSSKKSVATVSKSGKVRAQKAGNAIITAKVGKKKLRCKVVVKKKVYAKGIQFSETEKAMLVGETVVLVPTVTPSGITEKYKISWLSSDSSVASVDQAGQVTARSSGTTVITATLGKKKAACTVTVATGAQRLQSFLISRGAVTAENTYSIAWTDSFGATLHISFNTLTRQYMILHQEQDSKVVLTCNESFTGDAPVYYYWRGENTGVEVEAETNIHIPTYHSSSKLSVRLIKGSSSSRSLVEAGVLVAMYSFQAYLDDMLGIGLNQIGFLAF